MAGSAGSPYLSETLPVGPLPVGAMLEPPKRAISALSESESKRGEANKHAALKIRGRVT